MKDLKMIDKFTVEDGFFGRYEKLIVESVIPYQEKALNDMIEGAEKSHCIENFRMAAKKLKTGECDGEFYGMVFQDSDVAKWLEGAAYSLVMHPDKALEKRCDEVIEIIGSAQWDDGYLNTYFTVKSPELRWTNLGEAHELYCAGHMIEAAVAYAECTGKTRLLEIMCRMADHIYNRFITEKEGGYSGHPEIELALMRLYRCTGNEKYKELALHFIDVRGVDKDFFVKQREKWDWTVWGNNPYDLIYNQNYAPVREQDKAVGHAVRAVYLYTGMADAADEFKDEALTAACKRLWDNIVSCRMYVTGGIGSAYEGEAFTKDYHLPNDSAYCETCASIGLIFFANKMLKLDRNAKYSDVMERALYNCVLAGMELDGTKFFYVNPLEVLPGISGESQTHRHTLPVRPKWFTCACCPPNVARLLPSIAEYAWHIDNKCVYSDLFIGGTLDLSKEFGGKITLKTGYPYNGKLVYGFTESMDITLAVRVPNWSDKTVFTFNGKDFSPKIKNGYAYINGFAKDDTLEIEFDMSVKTIYANRQVAADSAKLAVQRGPLVYCIEGVDNDDDILSLKINANGSFTIGDFEENTLYGIRKIYADGVRVCGDESSLYSYTAPEAKPCKLTLVPYYTHANRGLTQMRVWMPY